MDDKLILGLTLDKLTEGGLLQPIHDYMPRLIDGVETSFTLATGVDSDGNLVLVILSQRVDLPSSAWVLPLTDVLRSIVKEDTKSKMPHPDFFKYWGIDPMYCTHCRCHRSEDHQRCCWCGIEHKP